MFSLCKSIKFHTRKNNWTWSLIYIIFCRMLDRNNNSLDTLLLPLIKRHIKTLLLVIFTIFKCLSQFNHCLSKCWKFYKQNFHFYFRNPYIPTKSNLSIPWIEGRLSIRWCWHHQWLYSNLDLCHEGWSNIYKKTVSSVRTSCSSQRAQGHVW